MGGHFRYYEKTAANTREWEQDPDDWGIKIELFVESIVSNNFDIEVGFGNDGVGRGDKDAGGDAPVVSGQ